MNEIAVSKVIEQYAIENAQARVQIATLQEKLKETQEELDELKEKKAPKKANKKEGE